MKLLATTATFEVRLGPFPDEDVWLLADEIMGGLDAHREVVGPMVVADAAKAELVVSFEFAATGEASLDVPRALEILAGATVREGGVGGRHRSVTSSVERLELAFAEAS